MKPLIVDAEGNELDGAAEGNLCIADCLARADAHRATATTSGSSRPISRPIKGLYFTGDGCRRDEDGYYWITGRVDDVINVSGHRMGTAEVESALVAHPKVAEAAVVGYPHDIKGQGIYAYVTLKPGEEPTDALRKELVAWVRKEIGPIAAPDVIQWAPGLPKTRSRQDHAPHPAQDRRQRDGQPGRHLHAGRPRRGDRSGARTACGIKPY